MAEYSVLIVDDDVWMQRILSKTLQSYGFKKTYLASNGFDGIGKAVEFHPDLIVLDILMPELSGHLTLKVIKSIKMIKDIPVIMVSALSDVENLGRAVKSGTAGFISKPFTRATVYEKLLDLYGKEKLDLIQKGMDINEAENLGYYNPNDFGDLSEMQARSGIPTPPPTQSASPAASNSNDEELGFSMPDFSKEAGSAEADFTDDDQKSIDSIKELLLKQRK